LRVGLTHGVERTPFIQGRPDVSQQVDVSTKLAFGLARASRYGPYEAPERRKEGYEPVSLAKVGSSNDDGVNGV
jgi:hypothetical protein